MLVLVDDFSIPTFYVLLTQRVSCNVDMGITSISILRLFEKILLWSDPRGPQFISFTF